jgi:hypothetical protein
LLAGLGISSCRLAYLVRMYIPALGGFRLVLNCVRLLGARLLLLLLRLLLLLCDGESTDEDRRGQRREFYEHVLLLLNGKDDEFPIQ